MKVKVIKKSRHRKINYLGSPPSCRSIDRRVSTCLHSPLRPVRRAVRFVVAWSQEWRVLGGGVVATSA